MWPHLFSCKAQWFFSSFSFFWKTVLTDVYVWLSVESQQTMNVKNCKNIYSFPALICHSLSSQISILRAGKCTAVMMSCAVCQTGKKSYSNQALRKCNYSPLLDHNLYPCTVFSANQSVLLVSYKSPVLSDFPFQFLYFPFSSQLCLSPFFYPADLASRFLGLDLIFFISSSWYFPPLCLDLLFPLLRSSVKLIRRWKSLKDCFLFPMFISTDKNMVPIEYLYNILKIWATFAFAVTSCLPSDCWGSILISNKQQRDWCLNCFSYSFLWL